MMIGPEVETLPLFSPFFPLILLLASGVEYGGMLSSGSKGYLSDGPSTNSLSVFSHLAMPRRMMVRSYFGYHTRYFYSSASVDDQAASHRT